MPIGRRDFLSAGAAAAAAATLRPARARAAELRPVSVRFNWTMKGEFTPFVVAREKGFYAKAGIDAHLEPGSSGSQAVQSVAVGHDQFGYVPSIQLIEGIAKGMPLRAVAACGNYTGMCWASRADVPLTGPRALEGHKVSISPSSTFFQVWDAFAKEFKIDKTKVDVVSADPSARVGLFLDRRVDIMADIFLANDYVILESKAKEKLNLFKLSQVGFDPLGYLLITNTGSIEGSRSDPKLVKAFTAATLEGFKYTEDHPDEAAEIMTRAHDQLGAAVIRAQVRELLNLMNTKPVLGKNEPEAWKRSLNILRNAGVIDTAREHAVYYTNAFLP